MRVSWRICCEGLCFGEILTISFQRFLSATPPSDNRAPPSLGALNLVQASHDLLLPLLANEAVWLGLTPKADVTEPWVEIRARFAGRWGLVMKGSLAPGLTVFFDAGLRGAQSVFSPGAGLQAFGFTADGISTHVSVVGPELVPSGLAHSATSPANPNAGYRGFRLP